MVLSLTVVLEDGHALNWDFDFSENGTLRLTNFLAIVRLPWVRLDFWKCPACTLDRKNTPMCPVAMVLAQYALDLADRKSIEQVKVYITESADRKTTIESVPLQKVAGELVRLAVFQSQCPVGRKVKPAMASLHTFPASQEILRAFALFFALRSTGRDVGEDPEQVQFMHSLHEVFGYLSKRLENAGKGDVYLNAVVILHSLSTLFSLSAPELIQNAIAECRSW